MIKAENKLGKRLMLILVVMLLLIMLSAQVSAWGVLPSRQHAKNTFEAQELKVTLRNTDFKDGHFLVRFSGPLEDKVFYNGRIVHITRDQQDIHIPFILQLDEELDAGRNTVNVILEEVTSDSSAQVSIAVTLVAEVVVDVPYEGDHVKEQVFVHPASISEPTPITISLLNVGTTTLPVWAELLIKGPTNAPLAKFETDKLILDYGAAEKFEIFWEEENKNPGEYVVEVTLHYGEKFKVIRQPFVIGEDEVVSESISSNNFNLGQIVPVDIVAKNNWNSIKESVFAEIFVLTKTGNIVQSFKSGPEDMPPRTRVTLEAFWDTTKLTVGEYDLNVLMHFDDKTTQKQYPAVVSLDKLVVKDSISGQVIGGDSGETGENKLVGILIVLVIVLVGMNVTWFVIIKSKRKKKK